MPKPRVVKPGEGPVTRPSVTCTLIELMEAIPSLKRIVERPLPAARAYHIAKLVRLVEVETKHYVMKRDALVKEFGEEVQPTEAEKKAGQTEEFYRVLPTNLTTFREKVKELDAVEVTIEWGPISIEWFKGMDLPAMDLLGLGPLLKGELEAL